MVSSRHLTRGVPATLRVVVRSAGKPVAGARVRLGRFTARTNASGVARLHVRFTKAALAKLRVTAPGARPASVRIRIRKHARATG